MDEGEGGEDLGMPESSKPTTMREFAEMAAKNPNHGAHEQAKQYLALISELETLPHYLDRDTVTSAEAGNWHLHTTEACVNSLGKCAVEVMLERGNFGYGMEM